MGAQVVPINYERWAPGAPGKPRARKKTARRSKSVKCH